MFIKSYKQSLVVFCLWCASVSVLPNTQPIFQYKHLGGSDSANEMSKLFIDLENNLNSSDLLLRNVFVFNGFEGLDDFKYQCDKELYRFPDQEGFKQQLNDVVRARLFKFDVFDTANSEKLMQRAKTGAVVNPAFRITESEHSDIRSLEAAFNNIEPTGSFGINEIEYGIKPEALGQDKVLIYGSVSRVERIADSDFLSNGHLGWMVVASLSTDEGNFVSDAVMLLGEMAGDCRNNSDILLYLAMEKLVAKLFSVSNLMELLSEYATSQNNLLVEERRAIEIQRRELARMESEKHRQLFEQQIAVIKSEVNSDRELLSAFTDVAKAEAYCKAFSEEFGRFEDTREHCEQWGGASGNRVLVSDDCYEVHEQIMGIASGDEGHVCSSGFADSLTNLFGKNYAKAMKEVLSGYADHHKVSRYTIRDNHPYFTTRVKEIWEAENDAIVRESKLRDQQWRQEFIRKLSKPTTDTYDSISSVANQGMRDITRLADQLKKQRQVQATARSDQPSAKGSNAASRLANKLEAIEKKFTDRPKIQNAYDDALPQRCLAGGGLSSTDQRVTVNFDYTITYRKSGLLGKSEDWYRANASYATFDDANEAGAEACTALGKVTGNFGNPVSKGEPSCEGRFKEAVQCSAQAVFICAKSCGDYSGKGSVGKD